MVRMVWRTLKEVKMNNMEVINNIKEVLNDVYLDWVNNFATIPAFASWYGVDEK